MSDIRVSQTYENRQFEGEGRVFTSSEGDQIYEKAVQNEILRKLRYVIALMEDGDDLIVTLETRPRQRREK